MGDGVRSMDGEHGVQIGKIPIPTGRPTMVSWLAGLHPHGWLRGILDNYVWKRKADLAGKTNPGSRQLSGWVRTRKAILTARAAMLWTSISCQAWRTRSYPHRRLWGKEGSTKREGGKETKFSTGKSGRINSSGSKVDGIEGQAPPPSASKGRHGFHRTE